MNSFLYACTAIALTSVSIIQCSQQLLKPADLGEQLVGEAQGNRLQVKVMNQFAMDGSLPSHSTDCGYHAPFNGLCLTELIQTTDAKKQQLLIQYLSSPEVKAAQFGPFDSEWKKIVLERKKHYSNKIVKNLLKRLKVAESSTVKPDGEAIQLADKKWITFNQPDKDKKQAMMLLAHIIQKSGQELHYKKATITTDPGNEGQYTYRISCDTIREYLIQALSKANKLNEEPQLREVPNLEDFIGLDKHIEYKVEKEVATWLPLEDIEALWAKRDQLTKLFQNIADTNLFILGGSFGNNYPLEKDPSIYAPEFIELRKQLREPDRAARAIILLYRAEEKPLDLLSSLLSPISSLLPSEPQSEAEKFAADTNAGNRGHWFTLVVNKVKKVGDEPDLQYILADSANNMNRLNDKRVNEAIALLEAAELPQEPQGSQDDAIGAAHSRQSSFLSDGWHLKLIICVAIVVIVYLIWSNKQKVDAKKASPAAAQPENPTANAADPVKKPASE